MSPQTHSYSRRTWPPDRWTYFSFILSLILSSFSSSLPLFSLIASETQDVSTLKCWQSWTRPVTETSMKQLLLDHTHTHTHKATSVFAFISEHEHGHQCQVIVVQVKINITGIKTGCCLQHNTWQLVCDVNLFLLYSLKAWIFKSGVSS